MKNSSDTFFLPTNYYPYQDVVFAFTGKLLDEATDLQNNLYRWYDAPVGGWMSEDPIGFASGDANLNRYVGNMPTMFVDPFGLVGLVEPLPVTDPYPGDDPGSGSGPGFLLLDNLGHFIGISSLLETVLLLILGGLIGGVKQVLLLVDLQVVEHWHVHSQSQFLLKDFSAGIHLAKEAFSNYGQLENRPGLESTYIQFVLAVVPFPI